MLEWDASHSKVPEIPVAHKISYVVKQTASPANRISLGMKVESLKEDHKAVGGLLSATKSKFLCAD